MYLLIVCAVSWPFQILFGVLGDAYRPMLLLSMIMAGVGTCIAGKYVFQDSFAAAGWQLGRPLFYVLAFALPLLLWLLPVVVEQVSGITDATDYSTGALLSLFATTFLFTLLPAFGEEFSWRGYLLPRLLKQYSPRKALLLHGFVTWFWHLPFLVILGFNMDSSPGLTILAVLLISLVPAVMHAVVFAWFWARSGSLLLVTVYHAAFDETRDSLQATFGFGWFAENWQMLVLTILGIILLARTRWLSVPRALQPGQDH